MLFKVLNLKKYLATKRLLTITNNYYNIIQQHIEVTKLRPLQDLSHFSMDGNPMASLEHSQLFVIFQLRSLNWLDNKKISVEERQMADKRFAQGNSLQ